MAEIRLQSRLGTPMSLAAPLRALGHSQDGRKAMVTSQPCTQPDLDPPRSRHAWMPAGLGTLLQKGDETH